MLDNPKTFTYHTQAFATGLTFSTAKIFSRWRV